jgi:hypothetical protein
MRTSHQKLVGCSMPEAGWASSHYLCHQSEGITTFLCGLEVPISEELENLRTTFGVETHSYGASHWFLCDVEVHFPFFHKCREHCWCKISLRTQACKWLFSVTHRWPVSDFWDLYTQSKDSSPTANAHACWKVHKVVVSSWAAIGIQLANCKIDMFESCSVFIESYTCSHVDESEFTIQHSICMTKLLLLPSYIRWNCCLKWEKNKWDDGSKEQYLILWSTKIVWIIFKTADLTSQVKWEICHNGMVCRQIADGTEGLQIWMAAANILNKELQTADKEWPSVLWIGWGLTTPYHNRLACYTGPWTWF